jgi:hypothetical protein
MASACNSKYSEELKNLYKNNDINTPITPGDDMTLPLILAIYCKPEKIGELLVKGATIGTNKKGIVDAYNDMFDVYQKQYNLSKLDDNDNNYIIMAELKKLSTPAPAPAPAPAPTSEPIPGGKKKSSKRKSNRRKGGKSNRRRKTRKN